MSKKFVINGGKVLSGKLSVQGSKNSALALLAASLVTDQPCHFYNVPDIEDLKQMIAVIKSLGALIVQPKENELIITAKNLTPENLDLETMCHIRASIQVVGALAARTESFTVVSPGGCQIGSRPLDAHLDAFRNIGFHVDDRGDNISFKRSQPMPRDVVLTEFSPTVTVNLMLAASRLNKSITIYSAAQEYAVQETGWFLKTLGVKIYGLGTHTLTVEGRADLKGADYTVMPDPIEVGTWIALAAATRSSITLLDTAPEFLRLELAIFKKIGVQYKIRNKRPSPNDNYQLADIDISPPGLLNAIKHVHNMPAPGFMPDILPPLAVLLTQAHGTSLIHDWMYEGRLRYLKELVKMGASANILDPHRAIIIGPTPLFGKNITSFDLRAGATLIIAALTAQGQSKIDNIYQVDRGYQSIDKRLASIGADIKRV